MGSNSPYWLFVAIMSWHPMQQSTIDTLLTAYIDGTISSENVLLVLQQLLADEQREAEVQVLLMHLCKPPQPSHPAHLQQWAGMLESITAIDKPLATIHPTTLPQISPSHRIHFLRKNWFRYAAAFFLLIGLVLLTRFLYRKQSTNEIARRIEKKSW